MTQPGSGGARLRLEPPANGWHPSRVLKQMHSSFLQHYPRPYGRGLAVSGREASSIDQPPVPAVLPVALRTLPVPILAVPRRQLDRLPVHEVDCRRQDADELGPLHLSVARTAAADG